LKVKTLALSLSFLIVLIACFQIPMAMTVVISPPPPPPPPAELLWWDPAGTNDIALSKDGQYVAAVGIAFSGELRFYNRSSETPKTPQWTWSTGEDLLSVAISRDGSCVAAGGAHVFFWKNAGSLTGTQDPTWTSDPLGPFMRRCLAISDDGNYVVAGAGWNVYYWANAKGKSSPPTVAATWSYSCGVGYIVHAVDMSSDGNYVVVGAGGVPSHNVMYWKDARSLPSGTQSPVWISTEPDNSVVDIAISDDGNYVAAATAPVTTVYYWAGARNRYSTSELSTWYGGLGVSFISIDMSSDGDSVIAGALVGALPPFTGRVYFWGGARGLTGRPQNPTWTYDTANPVEDVAINAAGDYMAAANDVVTSYVYFFDNKGNSLWNPPYQLDMPVSSISISSDGGTLAVGTGPMLSDYLFDTGYRTPAKPVGGFLVPVDKLQLLSPWITVALAALALTFFATKRRRKT